MRGVREAARAWARRLWVTRRRLKSSLVPTTCTRGRCRAESMLVHAAPRLPDVSCELCGVDDAATAVPSCEYSHDVHTTAVLSTESYRSYS